MKAWMKTWAVLCMAVLTGWPLAAPAQTTHTLPLVRPADFAGQESLVSIVNRSDTSGTVQVNAIDDTGERFGPVTLTLGARQGVNITSGDLERGNAAKGLPVGVGDGSGNWRLELATALTIQPLAYIRTPDKFMTSMHDVAPVSEGGDHRVPFFNPGSNTSKVSHLRIINPGTTAAEVTVTGRDYGGDEASGTVRLTLAAGAARTLTAQALEAGGEEFDGSLGDGTGKWRLNVRSTADIQVMSLLSTRTGHLANLSTAPSYVGMVTPPEPEPPTEPPPEPPPEPLNRFRDCPECPLMVEVPAGSFLMGSPDTEAQRQDKEGPVHRVTIARPFAVGVYEVTFDEWDACVSDGGCRGYRPDDQGWGRGRRPVINVGWNDVQLYVGWLSRKTGRAYRLLSEAEWEYAARAGTTTRYWWGNDILGDRANCRFCGSRWDNEQTAPVGSFSANPFGLYDVHGNVDEWVADCRNARYTGAPTNGSAWTTGDCSARVARGGSYVHATWQCRSASRTFYNVPRDGLQRNRAINIGFRVVRTITP